MPLHVCLYKNYTIQIAYKTKYYVQPYYPVKQCRALCSTVVQKQVVPRCSYAERAPKHPCVMYTGESLNYCQLLTIKNCKFIAKPLG